MPHYRTERPALLVFCQTALWSKPMHHLCDGRGIVGISGYGSSRSLTVGVCTCSCHADAREAERIANREAWDRWKANRAPLQVRAFELDRIEGHHEPKKA